ncbi:hypothetical protein GCM10009839_66310 [Catenulispora yoronensis]|uniref:Secreted protein n=1 Tax=Catenulispora yoronensis TaxID=450799 RepID=A0ABP5GLR3_9ACTN
MNSVSRPVGKRGRLALIAVAMTGVVGVGAGVASVASAAGTDGSPSAAGVQAGAVPAVAPAAQADVHPAAAAAATPDVITMQNYKLWLTAEGLHVQVPGASTADLLRVSAVQPGKAATTAAGDGSQTLWAGIYRGPVSDSTKVTITIDGRVLETKVTSLPGNPGWGVYYVLDAHGVGSAKPSIKVQNS